MTTQKFSKGEAIRFGWRTMKSNLGFFIILLIVVGLIYVIPDFIEKLVRKDAPLLAILIHLGSWVISIVVQMGVIKIALRFCDEEEAELGDLFTCFPLFFKYVAGSILYGLIVIVGLLLLIIPGIIWSIKFWFFPYFIVEEGVGPIQALKKSSLITRGAKWDLFLFGLLLGLINLLGALCLVIGLFATVPTTMVAWAYVYRELSAQAKAVQGDGVSTDRINSWGRTGV
ncbi:hypothetical protein J7M23_05540 [Candidatus Sumerlaeota bacterium]|nr:hypothetical protein [Candidatus Sumerlaeota bacterium]